MDSEDWRLGLQPGSRQRIVNKIMETLKRNIPFAGQNGIYQLAQNLEVRTYNTAKSQMLDMDSRSQAAHFQSNFGVDSRNPPDLGMQSQVHNLGQSLPSPLGNPSQSQQQLLPQNNQNSMTSAEVQNSAGLQPGMQPVSGLTQTPISWTEFLHAEFGR